MWYHWKGFSHILVFLCGLYFQTAVQSLAEMPFYIFKIINNVSFYFCKHVLLISFVNLLADILTEPNLTCVCTGKCTRNETNLPPKLSTLTWSIFGMIFWQTEVKQLLSFKSAQQHFNPFNFKRLFSTFNFNNQMILCLMKMWWLW